MKQVILIILFSNLLFYACKKKKADATPAPITTVLKNGLPENIHAVNGYFFASYNPSNTTLNVRVAFNDPVKDFLEFYNHDANYLGSLSTGNVDVGTVWYDGVELGKDISTVGIIFYWPPPFGFTYDGSAKWKTNGNGSFEPIDLNITRGYPTIVNRYNVPIYNVKIGDGLKIDIRNSLSNFDSAIVMIESTDNKFLRKAVGPGVDTVRLSSKDLSVFSSSGTGTLKIYGCNYSNQIVKNISYVFELITKEHIPISISQ